MRREELLYYEGARLCVFKVKERLGTIQCALVKLMIKRMSRATVPRLLKCRATFLLTFLSLCLSNWPILPKPNRCGAILSVNPLNDPFNATVDHREVGSPNLEPGLGGSGDVKIDWPDDIRSI